MFKHVLGYAALVTMLMVNPVSAQGTAPTSPQAKQIEALVNKAATVVEGKGDAAFADFRIKGSEWYDKTYLFAYDTKLNVLLVAAFPQNEGKNQTGKTDSKGKLYHDEFVKVVQSPAGSGWVNYWFPKPGQTQPSEKWSYVKAVTINGVPGLIGAGFYPE